MQRCWNYYKCKKCGLDGLANFEQRSFFVCRECGEKVFYDEKLENDWLNEIDENGEKVRMDFSGISEEACRRKAAKHFKCKKEDIDYYIVKNEILSYTICASKREEYKFSPETKKIVLWRYENRDKIWIAFNTKDKTILYPSELGHKEIKYDKIIDLIIGNDPSKYTVVILPMRRIPIMFYSNCFDNISGFVNLINNEISSHAIDDEVYSYNRGMYNEKYYRINKFESMGGVSNVESTNIKMISDGVNFSGRVYIWKESNELCLYHLETREAFCFDINRIKYYRIIGEKYATTEVYGGGGGGSSITGAILGGVIAGDAGAIIGSRKKVDEIKSHTVIHDDQKVLLYSDDLQQNIEFNSGVYSIFLKLIPEKEYYAVIQSNSDNDLSNSDNDDAMELLDKLGNLYKSGVITEEEFNTKKQELLKRI